MKDTTRPIEKYEYMLHAWGGFYNDKHKIKHGLNPGYFFFDTKGERDKYLDNLHKIETELSAFLLAHRTGEGTEVRYKTIASVSLEYKGKNYEIEKDFGFHYPISSAHFMFNDGNYGCDCNLSGFIIDAYNNEIPELDCGNEIKIIKLDVMRKKDNTQ